MDSVYLLDFASNCRVCLAKRELTTFSHRYSHLFLRITNIHVEPEDGLPQNICLSCAERLEDISEFIEFSKSNDSKLRRILNNRKESASFREQEPVMIEEDIISIKDENEVFDLTQDGWIGEEELAPEMDFEDSEECVPEYIEMKDIQESINQSISEFEPSISDFSSSGTTTFQDITSETVPTEDTEHIGGEASMEGRNKNEKNPFAPKKTLIVRLMRLKILRLKAKSVNFKSIGNSNNNFVTIRMGTKPQTNTNVQSVKTGEKSQEHGYDFSESNVEQFDENYSSFDTPNFPSCDKTFDMINEETVSVHSDRQRISTRDSCLFCKKEVLCFASHVLRYHSEEKEVVQIMSYPTNSKERKLLMSFLRKKSNYLKNSETCCNPMRQPMSPSDMGLECAHCLELYKQLCNHVKKFSENPTIKKIVQADVLSILFPHIDEDLKLRVFSRMRADHVTMVAKKDNLICEYGLKFLKTHPVETHVVHVTSRKMRELARFLIEVNKMDPSIKSIQDALQPQFYELIVNATRIIGKYDSAHDTYECPTFVTSIGYMLRQCCDIAIALAHERRDYYADVDTDEVIFNLNLMYDLFGTNWKKEVLKTARNWNL